MEIIIIAITALIASLLTFFSGFGLGTLLTPVMALFFPVEVAIVLTGVVHLLNNLFKMLLVGKHVQWKVALQFGAPAIAATFLGAGLLIYLSHDHEIHHYYIGGRRASITVLKLSMAALFIVFAMLEILPSEFKKALKPGQLYLGGLLSGFFGGLSGNQGALRSMFLLRCGLSKEAFIATGVFIACVVDVGRLSVYFGNGQSLALSANSALLMVAVLSAFTGAFLGRKLLKKVTFRFVQNMVASLIIMLAIALGAGII